MSLSPRLRLCLPPIAACWADVAATLLGQPVAYWCGDFAAVIEFNPLARLLLQAHPLAFVVAAAASCGLVAAAVVLLNRRLAVVLAFAVTFCHTVAAAAWAARAGAVGVVGAVAILIAAERLVALSWRSAPLPSRQRRSFSLSLRERSGCALSPSPSGPSGRGSR